MPTFFKASNTYTNDEIYENGIGDARGYFEDGAYVARASMGPQLPDTAKTVVEPQEAFTAALKQRFLKQRELLHHPPLAEALAALDGNHPISFPAKSSKAHAEWHRLIRTTAPRLAQLRSMDQEDVLRLLELIQKHFLKREGDVAAVTSTWIWSLLARLHDVGTMDNDQVFAVREFGKKALLVQVSFAHPAVAEKLERVSRAEGNGEVDVLNITADEQSDGKIETSTSDPDTTDEFGVIDTEVTKGDERATIRRNTLAILDTIIVLVSEIFGQRDLLEERLPWETQPQEKRQES